MKHAQHLFQQLNDKILKQQQQMIQIQYNINQQVQILKQHEHHCYSNLLDNFKALKQQYKFFSQGLKDQWKNICSQFIQISTKLCVVFIQQMMKIQQEKGQWKIKSMRLEEENQELSNALNKLSNSQVNSQTNLKNIISKMSIHSYSQVTPKSGHHKQLQQIHDETLCFVSDKITELFQEEESQEQCTSKYSKKMKSFKSNEYQSNQMRNSNYSTLRNIGNNQNYHAKKRETKKCTSKSYCEYLEKVIAANDRHKMQSLSKKPSPTNQNLDSSKHIDKKYKINNIKNRDPISIFRK